MSNNFDNSTPIKIIETEQSNPKTESTTTNNKPNVNSFSQSQIEDGRMLATFVHLIGFLTSLFGPLIIYVITTNPLVKMHAKNALNFQISLAIYFLVSGILSIILIGLAGILVFSVLAFVLPIIATIKAADTITEDYQYPFTIKLIS